MATFALPFGVWTLTDGQGEVLFNREFQPLWGRSEGEAAVKVAAERCVALMARVDHKHDVWLYGDEMPEPKRVELACAALREWGVPIPTEAELELCLRSLLMAGKSWRSLRRTFTFARSGELGC